MDTLAWARSSSAPDFGWPESHDQGTAAAAISSTATSSSSSAFPLFSSVGPENSTAGAGHHQHHHQPGWFGNYWQPRFPLNYPPGPGSGLSRQSSLDDLTSMELEQVFDYEERFRVDRRKLESLILGRFEPIKETASDYFQRIGNETGTTVIWPSRLKVGAKSKKDPHIRIGGQEEGVALAKTIIMEHLDTKTRRVTMKMDVSYTDHSHIIGKGGNTIRRVMSETGCHIHFPDSNRSNPNEKSNQVSIAGEMEGVEKARARVRELTPLIFTFDLPIISSVEINLDPNDPFLRAIQDQYNIQLMFRQKQKNFHTTMAVVKGCEWEAARVKEATLLLIDHLCGTNSGASTPISASSAVSSDGGANQVFPVTMNMEISPIHHSVVVGKNNFNLRVIMQRTNTTILFPDAADPNIPPIRKGSVSITGAIHNVYSARQQLVGSLPLVMMFDMPDGIDIVDGEVQKIGEELDVAISIKPKHRQGSKSVLIKAQERNASSIYAARHRLLRIDDDEETLVVAEIPETYKTQPIPPNFLQSLGMSGKKTPQSPFPSSNIFFGGGGGSLPSPAAVAAAAAAAVSAPPPPLPYPSFPLATQAPWAMNNILAPNHPCLQEYALLVLNNMTRLHQQQQQHQLEQQKKANRDFDTNNNAWAEKNELKVNHGHHSPPIQGCSPRNSSPVQAGGNLTNNLSQLDATSEKLMQLSVSDEKDEGLGTPGNSMSSNSNLSNFLMDRRAPGCEKKSMQMLDYDQKRLMATRAMHNNKPNGNEARTPTTSWSGLGFSNSMPEKAMRENMDNEDKLPPSAAAALPPQQPEEVVTDTNWFGNSSVLDLMLNKAKLNNPGIILPTDDLPTLFSKQGLAKYTDLFVRHEVDLQTFATLTDQDLREIGVQTFGARKKLLLLANKVKQTMTDKW